MTEEKKVQLIHGGGGQLQNELVQFITKGISLRSVNNGVGLDAFDDGATIPLPNCDQEIVFSADGHIVDPLFFPGGNLGILAACGTINDIIMMGATPLAMSSVMIIEEGMSFDTLGKITRGFNTSCANANVAIITGDTKIMPRLALNGMIMSTSAVGLKPKSRKILDSNCQPDAKVILTGSMGDHGAALMALREGIELETNLQSDVCALTPLLPIIEQCPDILAMKDPTRGGVAAALNEWATKSHVSIWLDESKLVIKKEVKAVCDILGLDPLEITNEGKALICVKKEDADHCLQLLRTSSIGKDAQIIGEVKADKPGVVLMKTRLGGHRIIEMPMGEPIPRVC
jgi:hydrogenase expression/formation protein HypE